MANNKLFVAFSLDLEENGLDQAFATVKKDLAGILGKEVETVDHALLIKDQRVRNYFGFYKFGPVKFG